MTEYSKVFGPTDSVASVVANGRKKTQIGSDYVVRPDGPYTIYKMRISKGNVVNAKECAGILEIIATGVDGTFEYAYGNGTGGATNSGQNGPAEVIDCSIPLDKGSTISVYVNDAEIAKDVTVNLHFKKGSGKKVNSYATGGGTFDCTADTLLSLTNIKPTVKGVIKEIRFAGSVIADAEAGSAKLVLSIPGLKGPFEYAVGNGPGGATLGGPQHADVIDLPQGIPVKENVTVTVEVTAAEALKSPTCSVQVV